MSTRIIGGIIMTHGDDNGLVLPPAIAPTQIVVVPVQQHKAGVLEAANAVFESLKSDFRVEIDDRDQSPGWKFAEHEMRGVPVRLELGPRDIEAGVCVLARRDNGEKITAKIDELSEVITKLLDDITKNMYETAKARRNSMTYTAETLDELKEIAATKPGFIKTKWCGSLECEMALKEQADVTSRCMPFDEGEVGGELHTDVCVCCGKKAEKTILWGKAY
jgi:prolyl-tRNA synthetase